MYECLIQFQKIKPNPFLPYASGLSYEVGKHATMEVKNSWSGGRIPQKQLDIKFNATFIINIVGQIHQFKRTNTFKATLAKPGQFL